MNSLFYCELLELVPHYCFHRVIEFNHGNIPITFKQFESVVNRLESPESCAPVVDKDFFGTCVTPIDKNHDEIYGVPSYAALELDEEEHERGEWVGGETEALRRLKLLEKEVSIKAFLVCMVTINCLQMTGMAVFHSVMI